ncbi:lipase 3-like [Onthophagus taurus]|uniref:lipase 3-like n=1 Tax=Onthophagus taurus TaxID=166361 RepID=UPI0039BE062F
MLKTFTFFILTLIIAVSAVSDDDAYKDVDELIEKYGYTLEKHTVTVDGNILELHRIPNNDNKKVILIMHQFLTSSADFVSNGNQSLAFLLADENYDVWLGNARGNTYSRNHESLNPANDNEYWRFNLNDVAKVDLPEIIEYITTTTGAEEIFYVGHGQGSTLFYIMASELPDYKPPIKRMVGLAPMAHMDNMPNLFFRILNTVPTILGDGLDLKSIFGLLDLLLKSKLNDMFSKTENYIFAKLCDDEALLVELCAGFVNLIYGFDNGQIPRSKVPVMLSNAYAGSSFQQLKSYVDMYLNDGFAKNYKNLGNIDIPNAIFYGLNDWLISTTDIEHLADDLKNSLKLKYEIPGTDFTHISFLFGKDAKELVYEPLLEFLEGKDINA